MVVPLPNRLHSSGPLWWCCERTLIKCKAEHGALRAAAYISSTAIYPSSFNDTSIPSPARGRTYQVLVVVWGVFPYVRERAVDVPDSHRRARDQRPRGRWLRWLCATGRWCKRDADAAMTAPIATVRMPVLVLHARVVYLIISCRVKPRGNRLQMSGQ